MKMFESSKATKPNKYNFISIAAVEILIKPRLDYYYYVTRNQNIQSN